MIHDPGQDVAMGIPGLADQGIPPGQRGRMEPRVGQHEGQPLSFRFRPARGGAPIAGQQGQGLAPLAIKDRVAGTLVLIKECGKGGFDQADFLKTGGNGFSILGKERWKVHMKNWQ